MQKLYNKHIEQTKWECMWISKSAARLVNRRWQVHAEHIHDIKQTHTDSWVADSPHGASNQRTWYLCYQTIQHCVTIVTTWSSWFAGGPAVIGTRRTHTWLWIKNIDSFFADSPHGASNQRTWYMCYQTTHNCATVIKRWPSYMVGPSVKVP